MRTLVDETRAARLARPWSRHDLAFATSAVALVVLAVTRTEDAAAI